VIFAAIPDWLLASPVAFAVGCGVGFVASNRWKIVRRNGQGGDAK
jgi:hypothetical protein